MAALRTLREWAIDFEAARLAKAGAPTMEEQHDKRMALLRRLWVSEI